MAVGAPLHTAVTEDSVCFLGETGSVRIPNFWLPDSFHNAGNYIVALDSVVPK